MNEPIKNPHAVAMGRLGGVIKSEAKTAACKLNGARGGAPKGNKNAAKKVQPSLKP